MILTNEDLKILVQTISPLIDAKNETLRILIKADIEAAKNELRKQTKADIETAKNELRKQTKADIETAKNELKADLQTIDAKLNKRISNHERRIITIEDELDIPHPDKN